MHLIVYVSDFDDTKDTEYNVLRDIQHTAKRQNPKYNITGVLFFTHNKFVQVLEGMEEDLRRLMSNIEKDPRHANVEYLIDSRIQSKSFQTWNMDSFNLDSEQAFDRETLRDITQRFKETLLPRSDALVVYYKALLEQKAA